MLKISTAQLSNLLFLANPSEHSWQISPSIYPTFSSIKTWTVPPYSFMVMYDNDWGYVLSSEPQTLRHCLNFIDVILQIPICYRRRNRKGNTILKIHVQDHFTIVEQFYVYVDVDFYIRFLTFMLISTMVFMWWKIMVCDCISVMRDGVEHPTSFVEASQKRRSSKS